MLKKIFSKKHILILGVVLLVVTIFTSTVLLFLVDSKNYRLFKVVGSNMSPTFVDSQEACSRQISPMQDISRQDILVFSYRKQKTLVMRVVGLPGERVALRDGKVFIINDQYPNGTELAEDYLDSSIPTYKNTRIPSLSLDESSVGQGKYYMLGDNRMRSLDSLFVSLV